MDASNREISAGKLAEQAEFLRRLARSLVPNEHLAEDLAQEAALAALRRPPEERGRLRAWLASVARNRAVGLRREAAARSRREREAAAPESYDPEVIRVQRSVFASVEALDEPYRETIWLRFYEDEPPRRIAARMGVPVETVKTRLRRGLEQLRQRLDGEWGERGSWCRALTPFLLLPREAKVGVGSLALLGALMAVVAVVASFVGDSGSESRAMLAAIPEPLDAEQTEVALAPIDESYSGAREQAVGGQHEGAASLTLHARWSDGSPATGIQLRALCWNEEQPRRFPRLRVTDETGIARFDDLVAGYVGVYGHRFESAQFELKVGQHLEEVFDVPSGVRVSGIVLDPEGLAMPGAWIWLGSASNWSEGWVAGVADERGEFRLRDVGPTCSIGARAPGWAPTPMIRVCDPGRVEVEEVALEVQFAERGGDVSGSVRDPDGNGVAEAQIKIGPRGGNGERGTTAAPPMLEKTDEQGRFEYPGVAVGRQPVLVLAEGFPLLETEVDVPVMGRAEVEIVLERPFVVMGRVSALGEPVAGAAVRFERADPMRHGRLDSPLPWPEGKTGEDGTFRIEWVGAGDWWLHATAPRGSGLGRASTQITVGAGIECQVDLQLDPGLVIRGRILTAEGEPAPERYVGARPVHGGARVGTRTNASGEFVLTNCLDVTYDLEVTDHWRDGFPSIIRSGVSPQMEPIELMLPLRDEAKASVEGTLLTAAGAPVRSGSMMLSREGRGTSPWIDRTEDGGFRATGLLPGTYSVVLYEEGEPVFESDPILVDAAERVDLGTLFLGETVPLTIRVNAAPDLRDALDRVSVHLRRGDSRRGLSPEFDGEKWKLDSIPVGDYVVRFFGQVDMTFRTLRVRGGSPCVAEFDLERCERTTVDLSYPDNAVAERVEVEVLDVSGDLVWRGAYTPDREGRSPQHAFLYLPEGDYRLKAKSESGLEGSLDVYIDWSVDEQPVLEMR